MKVEIYYGENANMGNYVSRRFGVTIKLKEDYKTKKEVKDATDEAFELAKELVDKKIKEAKEEKDGKR